MIYMIYDMMYLTAIVLKPGGNSTIRTHLHKNKT